GEDMVDAPLAQAAEDVVGNLLGHLDQTLPPTICDRPVLPGSGGFIHNSNGQAMRAGRSLVEAAATVGRGPPAGMRPGSPPAGSRPTASERSQPPLARSNRRV